MKFLLILTYLSLFLCLKCNLKVIYLNNNNNNIEVLISKLENIPILYKSNPSRNNNLKKISNINNLKINYKDIQVILSSSNSYSHDKITKTLGEYLDYIQNISSSSSSSSTTTTTTTTRDSSITTTTSPTTIISNENEIYTTDILNNSSKKSKDLKTKSNETYYLFGNNDNVVWKQFEQMYNLPPCKYCKEAGAVTVGIGGKNSGVSFHYHGPGFSEVIHGSKKFFLFPPHVPLESYQFHPNMTQQEWYEDVYPLLVNMNHPDLYHCEIFPGDILYFPNRWYHGTLNMQDYNFFVSVFLDLQLMKNKEEL